jgi:hypothetical protein
LLALPLFAQDDPDIQEDEEIRRYTVEVIVFRYAQDVSTGSEVFLPDEPEEPELLEEDLSIVEEPEPEPAPGPGEAQEEEPEPLPDAEFVLLAEEDYQMGEILERLERLDVYEPLMHFGWTQATWPEEQTEPLSLHRFAQPPEGLDGELTLYLERFLHLVVDLQLAADQTVNTGDEIQVFIVDFDGMQQAEISEALRPTFYRIREDRILRSDEVRYFDHPKFGVLARVTRVEEEEEDPEGELLGYPLE